MSSESLDPQITALSTLSLLETRLRRIEFLLTGLSDHAGIPTSIPVSAIPLPNKDTIASRLQNLQDDLNKLRKLPGPAGDLIRDVESLHSQTPEIFADPTPSPLSSLSDQTTHIFANTPLYIETASRLSSLQTLTVPPAEQSGQLLDLRPRIDAARSKQDELEAQARDLRERSVQCLEWWVRFGVIGMGELWNDWEQRVRQTEKDMKRIERTKAAKEGYV